MVGTRMLTNLCHDLELPALAVLGLGNGGFETVEGFLVEFLYDDIRHVSHHI